MQVTIFKNVLSTSTGFHRPVNEILERIRTGKSKKIVERVRTETDHNLRNDIKKDLPAICFSGTFNKRSDNSIIEHSGLLCLDFDKFPDEKTLNEHKELLLKDKYTYSLFISPSGNGLKVLVKIPPVITEHRNYFKSIQEYYNNEYFDSSCINESRVCYESYDPDIFINNESKVYDIKIVNPTYEVGKDKHILPLKSTNQIIQNIMVWFNDKYTMSQGNRNNAIHALAGAFSDYGIDKNEAEKVCLNYASETFTEREIENAVNSAYTRYSSNFGTKFFEDEHTKNKIKKQIKNGDDFKKIKTSFNQYSDSEIETAIDEIKEVLSITEFWDYTKDNRINLSHHKYKQFLEQNGYYKMFPAGNENYIFIYVCENLVSNTSATHIKDFILNYLYSIGNDMKPYDFMAASTKYFKDEYLTLLETSDIKMKEDTKEKCYLYFKNCVVEISSDKIKEIDYLELDGYVWEKHIIDREYKKADPTECDFEKFIVYIAGENMNRFKSLCSVIGYLLHSFKSNSTNKAVIFNDEIISENPNGGSGKGILCNSISKMKRVATIDGKLFDTQKSFPYQTVSADTQVLVFDDVKRNFPFENLFSLVTEGITLEKKNKDAIKLPVTKSPKIVITTNYTIIGDGGSFDRRKFEVELSSFFNSKNTPEDVFGHMLYDDWDISEWSRFDNFMIECVMLYLKSGLIPYEFHNLETRKFINSTSFEFYEWIEDEKLPVNVHVNKNDIYDRFFAEYEDQKKYCTKKKFSKWLDTYGIFKGYEILKSKSNGVRYTIYKDVNSKNEDPLPF